MCGCFLVLSVCAPAATVTLTQGVHGYTGCADTYLNAFSDDRNYGSDQDLLVHHRSNPRRTVIRFDQLPTLPHGYVIDAARLSLTYFDDYMTSGEWIDVGVSDD